MTPFLHRVDVPVNNNRSRWMLRAIARGRATYLFVGNDDAGQNLAMPMSLVLPAELCGNNPQAYLADVLMRILEHPASRIDAPLPQNCEPSAATQ